MNNATILYTENGDIIVKIISDKMTRIKNPEDIIKFSNGVIVDFYTDTSDKKSVLTCENATVNNKSQIMIATDNVILVSSEKKELMTERMRKRINERMNEGMNEGKSEINKEWNK